MERQFISKLQAHDQVDEVYRVADKQVRANRQGASYLLLQLMDRTGQISGLRWNSGQNHYESFQKGDYLRILGGAQLHNGILQIIVQDFELVPHNKIDPAHFSATDPAEFERLLSELKQRLTGLTCPHLQRLMNSYLGDSEVLSQLRLAPAGIKTHHAYEGGLLTHVVDLLRLADGVAPCYPQLDREMLLVGVFLHDLGKLSELKFEGEMSYTDPGQLIGHLVQGVVELDHRARQIATDTGEKIPDEILWRLQHMIVSHHGCLEHGSPKVPMTLEAIVLHFLDEMDAKVNTATELIESDRNTDSLWTTFHPNLGRKLYKPSSKFSS